MHSTIRNGRRCGSVEKFTEMRLAANNHNNKPMAEPQLRPASFPTYVSPQPKRNRIANATPQPRPIMRSPPQQEMVYRPTTEESSSTAPTQKTYDRLAEVYSTSGDTVEFASNFRNFIRNYISYYVWIGLGILEILFGLVSIFFGALNYPSCERRPMIPVYLVLSGSILILHGLIRIFVSIPTPPSRRPQRGRSALNRDLCTMGVEALILLAMVIVVILGSVWVYGARYVSFYEDVFENLYCDGTIYWVAWWSVTVHLVVIGLLIFGVIVLLIYGSMTSN